MTRYNYRKPRSINLVSILVVLILVAGVYAGWKFGPVYYQSFKVDEILSDLKNLAADIPRLNQASRDAVEEKVINGATSRIHELGIADQPDQPVEVYFTSGYGYLNAKYKVTVEHPFGKTTELTFNRKVKVPKDLPGL